MVVDIANIGVRVGDTLPCRAGEPVEGGRVILPDSFSVKAAPAHVVDCDRVAGFRGTPLPSEPFPHVLWYAHAADEAMSHRMCGPPVSTLSGHEEPAERVALVLSSSDSFGEFPGQVVHGVMIAGLRSLEQAVNGHRRGAGSRHASEHSGNGEFAV